MEQDWFLTLVGGSGAGVCASFAALVASRLAMPNASRGALVSLAILTMLAMLACMALAFFAGALGHRRFLLWSLALVSFGVAFLVLRIMTSYLARTTTTKGSKEDV
jgi:hypothetical protein